MPTPLRAAWAGVALLVVACSRRDAPAPPPSPPPAIAVPAPRPVVEPPPPASEFVTLHGYRVDRGRDCDGFPATDLASPTGTCVGLVAHAEDAAIAALGGRFRPRSVLEDPREDGVLWIVDAGARRAGAGRLLRAQVRPRTGVSVEVVRTGLDRPHGASCTPEGNLLYAEVGRIHRLDLPARIDRVVVDALPSRMAHRDRIRFHPLPAFALAANGDLYINMGSSTDHCAESLREARCADETLGVAAVWRATLRTDGTYAAPTVFARGLRNSVALAVHASGVVLQGENGVDFPEEDRPDEELNVLVEGGHYGWPYCHGAGEPDPRWAHSQFACSEAQAPLRRLPPHGAPLGLLYAPPQSLSVFAGRLIVALHGYRPPGHRLLAFQVDERGLPTAADPVELVSGWDATDTHPRGAPVGVTVARDGTLWFVEDNNGTVLRLARDRWSEHRAREDQAVVEELADPAFAPVLANVLRPRCAHCHAMLREGEPSAVLGRMRTEGWLLTEGEHTRLWERLRPGAERRMPLDGSLTEAELGRVRGWLERAP